MSDVPFTPIWNQDPAPPIVSYPELMGFPCSDLALWPRSQIGGIVSHQRLSPRGAMTAPNGSASTKKTRRRVASVAQRRAANIRERRRMFNLNEAFDKLRRKVSRMCDRVLQCFPFRISLQIERKPKMTSIDSENLFVLFIFECFIDRCRHLPTKNVCLASKRCALLSHTLDSCRKYWPEHRRMRHAAPKSIRKVDIITCMRQAFHVNICHHSAMVILRIEKYNENCATQNERRKSPKFFTFFFRLIVSFSFCDMFR